MATASETTTETLFLDDAIACYGATATTIACHLTEHVGSSGLNPLRWQLL